MSVNSSLMVLVPSAVNDTTFISSTISETDYPVWSNATNYVIGDYVISTTTHRIYKSLRDSNLNYDPTDPLNRADPAPWWLDYSATNKWKMFDDQVSSQSEGTSPLSVVINTGNVNGIYAGALANAETIQIIVKDAPGGNIVLDTTHILEDSNPSDYYDYFFKPYKYQTQYFLDNIPPYRKSEVTIILTGSSGDVKCGMLAMGDLKPLGISQYGAKAKPKTYSYIKIDDYGNNKINRRKTAKDLTIMAVLETSQANDALMTITDLLDVPCVWVGTNILEYNGLTTFGLGSADVTYENHAESTLSLTVQGLI